MRQRWVLPGLIALLALVAVWSWGWNQTRSTQAVTTLLNNQYQRAFYQTLQDVQTLEVLLAKSLVAGAQPIETSIFGQISQTAQLALRDISALPVQDVTLLRTMRFLNQVSDFSSTLVSAAALGGEPSVEHRDTLRQLYNQAGTLNTQLHEVEREVERKGADFWEIRTAIRNQGGLRKPQLPDPGEANFDTINREMELFPTLIYDGPFSDHLERRTPLGLNGPQVTAEEARTAALRAVDRRDGYDYTAQVTGQTRDVIPSYRVEVVGRKGRATERMTVDIAKKGGEPVWWLSTRLPQTTKISTEEARDRAIQYLADQGQTNVEPSYHEVQDNAITFNFATVQNGVLIYPDLMKVRVALDNGQVLGLEQRGYLMMHHNRNDFTPTVTEGQAREKLSPNLKVTASRLVIIPTDDGKERLAWEFKGTAADNTYLLYIDAKTGREVKILQLVDVAEGTLTM